MLFYTHPLASEINARERKAILLWCDKHHQYLNHNLYYIEIYNQVEQQYRKGFILTIR